MYYPELSTKELILKKLVPSGVFFIAAFILISVLSGQIGNALIGGFFFGGIIWGWSFTKKWFPNFKIPSFNDGFLDHVYTAARITAAIFAGFVGMPIGIGIVLIELFNRSKKTYDQGESIKGNTASSDTGSRVYEYKGNFSYCLPQGWIAEECPDTGSQFKLAFGPIDNDFTVNINFVIENFNGSLQEYVDENIAQLMVLFKDIEIVARTPFFTNSGLSGECLMINNIIEGRHLKQIFYFFLLPGNNFITITCTSLESVLDKYLSVFTETIKSFEIIK